MKILVQSALTLTILAAAASAAVAGDTASAPLTIPPDYSRLIMKVSVLRPQNMTVLPSEPAAVGDLCKSNNDCAKGEKCVYSNGKFYCM